jgi:hypothetical protein
MNRQVYRASRIPRKTSKRIGFALCAFILLLGGRVGSANAQSYRLIESSDDKEHLVTFQDDHYTLHEIDGEAFLDANFLFTRTNSSQRQFNYTDLSKWRNRSKTPFALNDLRLEGHSDPWKFFRFIEDGKFVLWQDVDGIEDDGSKRIQMYLQRLDRVDSAATKIGIPEKSLLKSGVSSYHDLVPMNTNQVAVFDYQGTPTILDIHSASFVPIAFEKGTGKYYARGFRTNTGDRLGSISLCNGYHSVIAFSIWDISGKLIADNEFLTGYKPDFNRWDRDSTNAFFLNHHSFLVWGPDFLAVITGNRFNDLRKIELDLPTDTVLRLVEMDGDNRIRMICSHNNLARVKVYATATLELSGESTAIRCSNVSGWRLMKCL